jgi:hypothetical protein
MEVCHNDGDLRNNNLENLRYDSHLANLQDRILHGSKIGRGRSFTEAEAIEIRKARAGGCTIQALAQRWESSVTTIHLLCSGRTYSELGGPRTACDRRKKLTWAIVRQIRQDRKAGLSLSALGQKYSIDKSMASLIVNNKRWVE